MKGEHGIPAPDRTVRCMTCGSITARRAGISRAERHKTAAGGELGRLRRPGRGGHRRWSHPMARPGGMRIRRSQRGAWAVRERPKDTGWSLARTAPAVSGGTPPRSRAGRGRVIRRGWRRYGRAGRRIWWRCGRRVPVWSPRGSGGRRRGTGGGSGRGGGRLLRSRPRRCRSSRGRCPGGPGPWLRSRSWPG